MPARLFRTSKRAKRQGISLIMTGFQEIPVLGDTRGMSLSYMSLPVRGEMVPRENGILLLPRSLWQGPSRFITVRNEFELGRMEVEASRCYWLPSQLSIFTSNTLPPVVVNSDLGVSNFFALKQTIANLNLLLTLDTMRSSKDDVWAADGRWGSRSPLLSPSVELPTGAIRMVSVDSSEDYSEYGTRVEHGRSEAGCESNHEETNDSGIIRLADVVTPALSNASVSVDNCCEDADLEALREIEELVRAEALRKLKGGIHE